MVKHNPKAVLDPPETIFEKIKTEIEKNNYLTALFLESSSMEAYLISLISLSSVSDSSEPEKGALENIEKLSFSYLITVNNILANIDGKMYKKLYDFYFYRNSIAHYLIGTDFNDPEFKTDVKTWVLKGLELLKELSELHEKRLDRRAKPN